MQIDCNTLAEVHVLSRSLAKTIEEIILKVLDNKKLS